MSTSMNLILVIILAGGIGTGAYFLAKELEKRQTNQASSGTYLTNRDTTDKNFDAGNVWDESESTEPKNAEANSEEMASYVTQLTARYGTEAKFFDVTTKMKSMLTKEERKEIPAHGYNAFFNDPIVGSSKKLLININNKLVQVCDDDKRCDLTTIESAATTAQ